MAMQTKLLCSYSVFDGKEVVPLSTSEQKQVFNISKYYYPDGKLGNSLFSFGEHVRTELTLISDDSDAMIEVEGYESEDPILEGPDKVITLTTGKDEENMLVPGEYPIKIRTSEGVFQGFYTIRPGNLEWEGLVNIRKYLEAKVRGLSQNIYKQRRDSSKNSIEGSAFLQDIYRYLEKNKDVIRNNLKAIIDRPLIDIYKEYEIKPYSRRGDSKSQRWLSSKAGIHGGSQLETSAYYEKHSKLTYDIIENKFLKKMLDRMYELLIQLESGYSLYRRELGIRLKTIGEEWRSEQGNYERISRILNTKKAQGELRRKIGLLQEEQEVYDRRIASVNFCLEQIGRTKSMIGHYYNETWLKDISGHNSVFKPTVKLLRNKNYSQIYEVFRNINTVMDGHREASVYPYKKTSRLFEIYGYLIIKEVLEELGFCWTSGWLKDIENLLEYNGDLPSGESIRLWKDDYSIELIYDSEVNRAGEAKGLEISQIVSVNSRSRRPDALLKLYRDGAFKAALVVEMKCRKWKNIYSEVVDTDVMYQLGDYSSLRYYDGDLRTLSRELPVKKLLVLYPKQRGPEVFRDELYGFSFIQIGPRSLDERPEGYEELRKEIKMFLSEYMR